MKTTDGFTAAIEAAYSEFADIPGPTLADGSRYEERAEILPELASAALRELPERTIGLYAGWAMTTAGNEIDFMHVLPRIMEVAAYAYEDGYVGLEPQVVASKIIMAGWTRWNSPKREAVKRCFREAFLFRLESFGASAWLCGIAHLGLLSDDLFDRWLVAPEDGAIAELAHFIVSDLGMEVITGAYWEDVPAEAQRRVAHWLRSDAVRGRFQAALDRASPSSRENIRAALAVMEHPVARRG